MMEKADVAGANGLKEITLPFIAWVFFAYAWNYDVVGMFEPRFYGIGLIVSLVLFFVCFFVTKRKMSWKIIGQRLWHNDLLDWCAGIVFILLVFMGRGLSDDAKSVLSVVLLMAACEFLIYWVVLLCKRQLFR
jgi:hypothetical protein